MNELLMELKERLNQIAMVGLMSVKEDFRLKKLQEKLRLLSGKAPVLAKLYDLVTRLLEGEEVVATFCELNNLVNAILCTQGSSKVEGEKGEILTLEHKDKVKYLSRLELKQIRNILNGGTTTKWANLKKANDEGKLVDFRLLGDLLKQLGDQYVYEDYIYDQSTDQRESLCMVDIIASFKEPIVPILLGQFESKTNLEKANIVKILSKIGGATYNDCYKKWLEEEENDNVQIQCIRALGHSQENEELLLGLKTRKKKIQEARVYALAHFHSPAAQAEVRRVCSKDAELFRKVYNEVNFLSQEEFVECIKETAEILAKGSKEKDAMQTFKDKCEFLCVMLRYTYRYDFEVIKKVIMEVLEIEVDSEKQAIEEKYSMRVLSMLLLKSNDRACLEYLVQLKDKYNGYYLTTSFVAGVLIFEPARLYDEFSPYVLRAVKGSQYNIKHLLESLASKEVYVKYHDECVTCDKRKTCKKAISKVSNNELRLEIDRGEYVTLALEEYQWDKRWVSYTKANNLMQLSAYFMFATMDEANIEELKLEYIKMLEVLKAGGGNKDVYPNVANTERKIAQEQMKAILSGLFKTGASEIAIRHIPYFSFYLGVIEQIYFNELEETDLPLLNEILAQTENLSDYKKQKITDFIERAKESIAIRINGIYDETNSCS